jgi:CRISPR-associated helicase Cas3
MNRFVLSREEAADPEVARRLRASKTLYLHKGKSEDIISVALSHADSRRRVLVYVWYPKDAEAITDAIAKEVGHDRVAILTGTIRGHERDEMTTRPLEEIDDLQRRRQAKVFRDFRLNPDRPPPERSEYLVATSAGEVGIDLDADEIVCDLTYLDSMIQRFGRLNRLGRSKSTIQVVEIPPRNERRGDVVDERLIATRKALLSLPLVGKNGHKASPLALQALNDRHDAFSKAPRTLPLTDVLLDNWALTSLPELSPTVDRKARLRPIDNPDKDGVMRKYLGAAERWATVTPVVLPGHLNGRGLARRQTKLVLKSLVHAGIMTPVSEIHLQPDPIFAGAERAGCYRVPEYLRQFTRTHAIITFSEPVLGPVVIGAGRYIGLGLMAGLDDQD